MPSVLVVYRDFGRLLRGPVVVRLHGPDRAGIEEATGERWDGIVEPKDQELPGIAEMVNEMQGRGLTVYLNVNNHYEGSAPLTIERLRERGQVDLTGYLDRNPLPASLEVKLVDPRDYDPVVQLLQDHSRVVDDVVQVQFHASGSTVP